VLERVSMIAEVLTLVGGGLIVIFAAVLFTNAIEYLGFKMNWSGSFVGAVLAPLFTSFPELVVFLVAVFNRELPSDLKSRDRLVAPSTYPYHVYSYASKQSLTAAQPVYGG